MTNDKGLKTLEDRSLRLGLDRSTGWIRSLVWKPSGTDLFAQLRRPIEGYIGGIRIFDEVARRWYDDFDSDFRVRWVGKGKTLAFEKRFHGAPFVARIEFSLRAGVLEWNVELEPREERREQREARRARRTKTAQPNPSLLASHSSLLNPPGNRQVKVVFFLPLIAGWDVWAPAVHTPFTFDGMSSFEFMYNQGPYYGDREIMLPLLSHYNAKLNCGYTVCEHLDRNIPAAKFQFSNGRAHFNWSQYFSAPHWEDYPYLEVVHSYIGMRPPPLAEGGRGRACRTGIQLFAHEGDWRPGLGKVVARHKEFFFPRVDAIWDRAGVFHCGGVQTAGELERSRALGMKYLEVHGHFPWYGEYFNEEAPEWDSVGTLENRRLHSGDTIPISAAEIGSCPPNAQNVPKLSQARIEKALEAFKKHGVSPHYYINFSDGYREEVEKRWPDSIALQEDGKPAASGWHFCHLMNPDPKGAFGRHLLKNAAAAIARYPQLDGFFLDCFRHFEFDFGADDGVTLANNRPAYNVSFGLGKFQEALSKLLVKRGLDCFANKPRTAQTMRFVDGVLLEGQGDAEEAKWFWLCLAKPLFYMWGALTKPEEEYLKRSVVLGGWPKLPDGNWRQDDREFDFQKKLYGAYLPLYAHFRRRVVCFEPNPVRFSDGLCGQLYTRPDGAYVAGAMTDWTSVFDEIGRKVVAPYIAFRLKDAVSLGDVKVHYANEAAPRCADYYRTPEGLLVVDLPAFRTAAVVVLKPCKGSRDLGVRKLRDTRDYCGDPTSAFEFGSGAKEG